MQIWRFPLYSYGVWMSAVCVAVIITALLRARGAAKDPFLRGSALAGMIVSPLIGAAIADFFVRGARDAAAARGEVLHLSPLFLVAPSVLAIAVLTIVRVLFPNRRGNGMSRSATVAAVICFAFIGLNLMDLCGPENCERFGFPVAYSWRGAEAVLGENDPALPQQSSPAAAAVNVLSLAAILSIVAYVSRRPATRAPAGPEEVTR